MKEKRSGGWEGVKEGKSWISLRIKEPVG